MFRNLSLKETAALNISTERLIAIDFSGNQSESMKVEDTKAGNQNPYIEEEQKTK